jgi:phosphatidylglycerophosphate synthase
MTSEGRRPLKIRKAASIKKCARWLSEKNITPNQISICSILFASLSALCFFNIPDSSQAIQLLLLFMAALFIQMRLLCNLFDGMVAVEGGKGTTSGELFNDVPDRIADTLILLGAGSSITVVIWAGALGCFAAILSVMTAYIRTLSVSIGVPVNFMGPMAKQQRMATLTIGCIFNIVEVILFDSSYTLLVSLLLIVCGSMYTCYRRVVFAHHQLETGNKEK